ncbi:hypothetical protein PISMIDRAFT_111768, partial [Pisolithus microcarpus 441]
PCSNQSTAVTVRKKCYELFKKEYCDTWQEILIKFKESTQYTETGKTVTQRQQLFNKSAKRFTQSLTALSKAHGIKTAFVMAGSIVNQDASLGYVYTMPGAEDVSSCDLPLQLTHSSLVLLVFYGALSC